MTNYKKTLFAGIAGVLMCSNLYAQETNFDLSSQRSEKQDVLPVPGRKIDHQGLVINPTPQKLSFIGNEKLDISQGFILKDKQKKFTNDLNFVIFNKNGAKLIVDFGKKVAEKQKVKDVSGAYALNIHKTAYPLPDMMNGEHFTASRLYVNYWKARLPQTSNCLIWKSTIIPTCRIAEWSKAFTELRGLTK